MNWLIIVYILAISVGINYLFFIFAWILKSDVFTDLTYAMTFALISIIFFSWYQNFTAPQILCFVLINLWAIRLGGYLFIRIIKIKVDHRFDNMRNSFIKFFGFWNLQAFSVFLIVLPSILFLTYNAQSLNSNSTSLITLVCIISIFGLIYETIADYQNKVFYETQKKHKLDFLHKGLWKLSRHPNYFGEIVFWYGLTILAITTILINKHSNSDYLYILLMLSPIYVNLLIVYASGIKLAETQRFAKYDNIEFFNYVQTTSIVFPIIGKKGPISLSKKIFEQKYQKYLNK